MRDVKVPEIRRAEIMDAAMIPSLKYILKKL